MVRWLRRPQPGKGEASIPNSADEALPSVPKLPASSASSDDSSFHELPLTGSRSRLLDAQYDRSLDHVWHELERIDWLIKAQILRWRAQIGTAKPSEHWGTLYVTESEVDRLLFTSAAMPDKPNALFDAGLKAQIDACDQRAIDEASAIRSRLDQTEVELRLMTLKNQLELSDLQRDIVLVCLWPELDERYRRLYGYLMDDSSRMTPTIQLIMQILSPIVTDDEHVRLGDVRAALEGLVYWHMIGLSEMGSGVATPALRSVKLDAHIVNYLLDQDEASTDAPLSETVTPLPRVYGDVWQTVKQDVAQKRILMQLESWVETRRVNHSSATLLLRGGYGSGQLQAARAICRRLAAPFFTVDTAAALRLSVPWDEVVTRVYREALLRDRASVYWSDCETLMDDTARWEALTRAADTHTVVTFLESTRGWSPVGNFHPDDAGQSFVQIEFPPPSHELRVELWREGLAQVKPKFEPKGLEGLLRSLASSFQFTEGQIADALTAARSLALCRNAESPELQADDLYEGCRAQSGHDLQTLAQRIEPRKNLTLDDLVLPKANQQQFHELQARIKYRSDLLTTLGFGQRFQLGRGLIALFTGSSGTGKTMGAELLAQSMGVAIYRVDLSAVVSKYVGETEKNINRVFQLAEGTGAILFFDEADALFGKRGEVKDAQDRWANLEVNYLLQRVEQYSGVVILASNLRQNIDDAFARRIHVLIDFPFPDEVHRLVIWERMLEERDETQPDVRFPDAEYHGKFNPEWCARLEAKVRAIVKKLRRELDGDALEAKVHEELASLSRQRICKLLYDDLEALTPDERAALLEQEMHLLARRFQLAGGSIKNVVVDAAVRALQERDTQGGDLHIMLRHLVAGVTREYQKLGKPITRGEFGDPFYEWAKEDILL